jgi:hypothetical protein
MPQVTEGGKLDTTFPDGVGKVNEEQPVLPSRQPYAKVNVVIDSGSKLSGHAVEITGMLSETARYGGHGVTHPSTGSPIPNAEPDDDFSMTGVKQQTTPDTDND